MIIESIKELLFHLNGGFDLKRETNLIIETSQEGLNLFHEELRKEMETSVVVSDKEFKAEDITKFRIPMMGIVTLKLKDEQQL